LHGGEIRRRGARSGLGDVGRIGAEPAAGRRGDLARHAVDVHAVGPVGEDLDVKDRIAIGAFGDRLHRQPGGGEPPRQIGGRIDHLHELPDPRQAELHSAPLN
jgi:hypothetical protein